MEHETPFLVALTTQPAQHADQCQAKPEAKTQDVALLVRSTTLQQPAMLGLSVFEICIRVARFGFGANPKTKKQYEPHLQTTPATRTAKPLWNLLAEDTGLAGRV